MLLVIIFSGFCALFVVGVIMKINVIMGKKESLDDKIKELKVTLNEELKEADNIIKTIEPLVNTINPTAGVILDQIDHVIEEIESE